MYSWKGSVFSILTHFKSFLFYSHCLSVFFFSSSSGFGLFVYLCLSCLFAGYIAQRQQTKLTSLNNNCCASLHVSFLSPELQSLWTVSSSDQELWLAMGPGFTDKHSSFTLLSPFVTLIVWNFWHGTESQKSIICQLQVSAPARALDLWCWPKEAQHWRWEYMSLVFCRD